MRRFAPLLLLLLPLAAHGQPFTSAGGLLKPSGRVLAHAHELLLFGGPQGEASRYNAFSPTKVRYDNYVKLPQGGLQLYAQDSLTLRGINFGILWGKNSNIFHMQKDNTGISGLTGPYDDPELLGYTSDDSQQVIFEADGRAAESFLWTGWAANIKNNTGSTRKIGTISGMFNVGGVQADNGPLTLTGSGLLTVLHGPVFNVLGTGAGTLDAGTDANVSAVYSGGSFAGWTMRGWYGLDFHKPAGATGTGTTLAAVNIADIADGRFTTVRSLFSLGATVAMAHAGPVRIGDTATPVNKLEVLGNTAADVSVDHSGTTTAAPQVAYAVWPAGLSIGAGGAATGVLASGTQTITNAAPYIFALRLLFADQAVVTNANSIAVGAAESIIFNAAPTYTANGTTGGSLTIADTLSIPSFTTVGHRPSFTISSSGVGVAGKVAGLYAAGSLATGWSATDWDAVRVDDAGGAGTITNQFAVDIAALTRGGTLIAGVRSAIAVATGRWFLLGTGSADSATAGRWRVGDTTAPTAALDLPSGQDRHLRMAGFAGNPAAVTDGDHWYNTTQKSHRVRATVGTEGVVGTVATAVADSSGIANTTTETAFSTGSYTFPANSVTAGKSVRVTAWGRFSTTVTPTLQWNLRWGSVNTDPILVGTSALTSPISGAASEQWRFDGIFTVRAAGASGTADGSGSVNVPTTTGRVDATLLPDTVSGTTTIDTTASKVLSLFFKWGTASASNTILCSGFTVEVLD
jgi:hypothetical protein